PFIDNHKRPEASTRKTSDKVEEGYCITETRKRKSLARTNSEIEQEKEKPSRRRVDEEPVIRGISNDPPAKEDWDAIKCPSSPIPLQNQRDQAIVTSFLQWDLRCIDRLLDGVQSEMKELDLRIESIQALG